MFNYNEMRAKEQAALSKKMHLETKLVLSTNLDPPFYKEREGPYYRRKFSQVIKRKHIYRKLRQVELEITEKLQKLKMECFGDDMMNAEAQTTVSSNGIYEYEKPVRLYYLAIEDKNIYFEIPKSPEAFRKLWQEELEIIQKLQKLKLNQVKLEHKWKCYFCTYSESSYKLSNTRRSIERKVEEIEELKQSIHELYVSSRLRQRKDSNISSLHEQLHNGRHHGTNNLVKERQLLKKINQSREEVEKISANSPSEPGTRIYMLGGDILDTKQALTDYIKVRSREVEELRIKQMTYRAYDDHLDLEFKKAATEKEIMILERKLNIINLKKSKLASKPQLTAQI